MNVIPISDKGPAWWWPMVFLGAIGGTILIFAMLWLWEHREEYGLTFEGIRWHLFGIAPFLLLHILDMSVIWLDIFKSVRRRYHEANHEANQGAIRPMV